MTDSDLMALDLQSHLPEGIAARIESTMLRKLLEEREFLLVASQEVLECRDSGSFGLDGTRGFKLVRAAIEKALK